MEDLDAPGMNPELWDVRRHLATHVIAQAENSIRHTRFEFDLSQYLAAPCSPVVRRRVGVMK